RRTFLPRKSPRDTSEPSVDSSVNGGAGRPSPTPPPGDPLPLRNSAPATATTTPTAISAPEDGANRLRTRRCRDACPAFGRRSFTRLVAGRALGDRPPPLVGTRLLALLVFVGMARSLRVRGPPTSRGCDEEDGGQGQQAQAEDRLRHRLQEPHRVQGHS